MRRSTHTLFFFCHLGLSKKHIRFKIGDTFFPTLPGTPVFARISRKRSVFPSRALAHEPEEMRGSIHTLFFFCHLGLSEKRIWFKIGATFFLTSPYPRRKTL